MRAKSSVSLLLTSIAASLIAVSAQAGSNLPSLQAQTPIQVSAKAKRFDLVAVDSMHHRLLAAHSQAGTLTIVDTLTNKLEREIPVGESSGVAIDAQDGIYFVGTTKGVAVVNSKTLKKTAFIQTPGPTDAMAFDPANDRLYVGHDDGKELWIIDARQAKLAGHIDIPGVPELMDVDAHTRRLYLNIKDRNEVAVINLSTGKVIANWPVPATNSPHGLVLDRRDGRLFVAGHSSIVSVFSLPSGKRLNDINVGAGHIDQIAFDQQTGRLYCPSSGRLVAIQIGDAADSVLGSVAIPEGTHSVAVDSATHLIWIAYADHNHSYVQAFAPNTSHSSGKNISH